jgi:hypothetical protein
MQADEKAKAEDLQQCEEAKRELPVDPKNGRTGGSVHPVTLLPKPTERGLPDGR